VSTANALVEAAQDGGETLAYVFYILGIALMIAEIFLPGVVLGILGLFGCVAGIVLAFVYGGGTSGSVLTAIGVVALPAFLLLWVKVIAPAMSIETRVKDDQGRIDGQRSLVDREGVALTTLRPAGAAQVGDLRVDVVTEGEIIEKDTRIVVVRAEGNQITVRAVQL